MAYYPTDETAIAVEFGSAAADVADDIGIELLIDLRPRGVTIDSGKDRWEHQGFPELAARGPVDRSWPRPARRPDATALRAGRDRRRRRADRAGVLARRARLRVRHASVASPTSSTRASSPCRSSSSRCRRTRPSAAPNATAHTSTSSCPTIKPRRASRLPLRPVGESSTTPRRRSGGPSPTPRATRSTSP